MEELTTIVRETEPGEVVVIANGIRYVFPNAVFLVDAVVIPGEVFGDPEVGTLTNSDRLGQFTGTIRAQYQESLGFTMFSALADEPSPV